MQKNLISKVAAIFFITLMITSVLGTCFSTQSKPANNKEPVVADLDRQSVIAEFLKNPSSFKKVDAIKQQSSIHAFESLQKSESVSQTVTMPAQQKDVEKKTISKPIQSRSGITLLDQYPALGDRGMADHLLLANDRFYQNGSTIVRSMPFSGSKDYGANWSRGIVFVNQQTHQPLNYMYPSLDYWGKNGSLDRWYLTFKDYRPNYGQINLLRWETNQNTIVDLMNASNSWVYWNYSQQGFSNIKYPQIACKNNYAPWFFGVITMGITKTGYVDAPGYFMKTAANGSGTLSTWNLQGVQGSSCAFDKISNDGVGFWDVTYNGRQALLTKYLNITNMHSSGYYWYSSHWSYEYPTGAAFYDKTASVAMEAYNKTIDPTGTHRNIDYWRFVRGNTSQYDTGTEWYVDGPATTLRYPELAQKDLHTLILTAVYINFTSGQNYIVITSSEDNGDTWSDMYFLSGSDTVIGETGCHDLTESGGLDVWEYQYDSGNPDDDIISLHFSSPRSNVLVEGNCFYQNMAPVNTVSVEITNLNTGVRWQATTNNNHYSLDLVPDVNVTTGQVLRIIARDTNESVNVTDHVVTTNEMNNRYIHLDFILRVHYRDLKKFPFYISQINKGAMTMKMILDYCMWNSTTHPNGPPSVYSEQTLYNRYKGTDAVINGNEITYGLNHEIDDRNHSWQYGYFFNPYSSTNANDVLKQVCIWLDYPVNYYNNIRDVDVPKPGHPNHVPIAIPTNGNYNTWMTIRGIHTDRNAWLPPTQLNVYGFWLNDPKSGGLGDNTYVTVSRFLSTYFFVLNVPGDVYNGKYLAITDPPRDITVPSRETTVVFPTAQPKFSTQDAQLVAKQGKNSDTIVVKAAFSAAWDVLKQDRLYADIFAAVKPMGKPRYDPTTCTILFMNKNLIFTVLITRADGSLQEIRITTQQATIE